uniref:RING-type domain-containing protein n=1 Tax=Meloidogyne incognita TaxID=6306 RepID=A0A914MN00_MELIC
MSSNFGRCIICTLAFERDDISALRCGHTYHFECISTWINTSKTCPTCRKKNLARDIIRLYVDEPDKSMCQFPDSETSANAEYERKIKTLESQLKEILEEKIKVDDELDREKTMNNDLKARIRHKDEHIKRLEGILEDQEAMMKENSRLKQQLKASDLSKMIPFNSSSYSYVCKISSTANETEIEKMIDMYSTKNGDPSCGEFLKLIRKQMRAMEQKNKELLEQIRKERLENSKKDKEIERLREEISQSRKRTKVPSTSKESPMAIRQRTARPSFGFSFCEEDSEIQV